jgi:hypothetical protein
LVQILGFSAEIAGIAQHKICHFRSPDMVLYWSKSLVFLQKSPESHSIKYAIFDPPFGPSSIVRPSFRPSFRGPSTDSVVVFIFDATDGGIEGCFDKATEPKIDINFTKIDMYYWSNFTPFHPISHRFRSFQTKNKSDQLDLRLIQPSKTIGTLFSASKWSKIVYNKENENGERGGGGSVGERTSSAIARFVRFFWFL